MTIRSTSRVTVPRHIRPGTPRTARAGDELDCVVLASGGGEWVGVDLSSGALVRNVSGENVEAKSLLATSTHEVVTLSLLESDDPMDPARPEAISASVEQVAPRPLRRRAFRRLLRRLCAPELDNTPLLHTHGPSIAYVDLDGRSPSLVVMRTSSRHLEVMTDTHDDVSVAIHWAGTTQGLPVIDPSVIDIARRHAPRSLTANALSEALGWKPGFAIVGLSTVCDGHVKKVLIGLLAR